MSKEIQRMSIEEPRFTKVKTDENGSIHFTAVGVTKNKEPNRAGFVFDWDDADDIKLDNYLLNPAVLYMHNSRSIPVGWAAPEVLKSKLKFHITIPNLASDPDGYEFDKQVLAPLRAAVRNQLIKAVSIGFYVLNHEDAEAGPKVKSFEIVEISVCAIGAHEDSVIQGADDEGVESLVPGIMGSVSGVETQVDGGRLIKLSLPEVVSQTGADEPDAGDANGTQSGPVWQAIPFDTHSRYAIQNVAAEAPDPERDFKLEHHLKSGNVQWIDVAEAMGVILGARGGLRGLGRELKEAAYGHMKMHYDQFEAKAPEFSESYDKETLEALHEEGLIKIPGRARPKRAEQSQCQNVNPQGEAGSVETPEKVPPEKAGQDVPQALDLEKAYPAIEKALLKKLQSADFQQKLEDVIQSRVELKLREHRNKR